MQTPKTQADLDYESNQHHKQPGKFTWDLNDVEFEPGSGNGQPLVPDSMKEEAKRRLRQYELDEQTRSSKKD